MADTSSRGIVTQAELSNAAQAPPESGGLSLRSQLLRPRTLISFAVSLGILAFIFIRQDIPLSDVWANIRQANVGLYLLGFLAYYSSFYVRTLRWKQMLGNAGYTTENHAQVPPTHTLLRIIFLSWFANSILPAKLGDGYRGYLLKRNSNVSFSKTMGTILAERIADVAALFSLLLISGLLAFRDRMPPHFGLLVGFGAVLVVLSLMALLGLRYVGPFVSRMLPTRVRPHYSRLEEGVLLAFRRRVGWILLLTASVWVLESLRFWFVAASLGQTFSLELVIFIALAASLLTTVPFTPAGLGFVESAIVTVLLWVIQDESLAGSIALMDRTITYWSLVLFGAVVYLFSGNK